MPLTTIYGIKSILKGTCYDRQINARANRDCRNSNSGFGESYSRFRGRQRKPEELVYPTGGWAIKNDSRRNSFNIFNRNGERGLQIMQDSNWLSYRGKRMIWIDRKLEIIKLVFVLYAFVCGQALYHSYVRPSCPVPPHFIAADLMSMSLKQLGEVNI